MASNKMIIVFDGVCVLCNRSVDFIIKRDPYKKFQFIAAQSPLISQYISDENCLKKIKENDSIVLITGETYLYQSDAALKILEGLHTPLRILFVLKIIPKWFRNKLYVFVTKRRYCWFGRLERCPIPNETQRDRFL